MDWDDVLIEVAQKAVGNKGLVINCLMAFVYEDAEEGPIVMVHRTESMRTTEMMGIGQIIKEYAKDEMFGSEVSDD